MNHQVDVEDALPNWSRFYTTLNRLGPVALRQIPKRWVRWLQQDGAAADMFWAEDIEDCLFRFWDESPERAVEEALARYVESVRRVLDEFPFADIVTTWKTDASAGDSDRRSDCMARITCHPVRPRILRALVDAASQV